jgi:hypothetical protein
MDEGLGQFTGEVLHYCAFIQLKREIMENQKRKGKKKTREIEYICKVPSAKRKCKNDGCMIRTCARERN